MVPRSVPKDNLEAVLSKTYLAEQKRNRNYEVSGATWRFWPPLWVQLGAKGVPKSSISAPRSVKWSKNKLMQMMPEKTLFFDGIFVGKWEFLKMLNPPKCFVYRHFGGFRWLWTNREFHENRCQTCHQKSPKWSPQSIKIESSGARETTFVCALFVTTSQMSSVGAKGRQGWPQVAKKVAPGRGTLYGGRWFQISPRPLAWFIY